MHLETERQKYCLRNQMDHPPRKQAVQQILKISTLPTWKYYIIRKSELWTLNKRNELASSYRHKAPFLIRTVNLNPHSKSLHYHLKFIPSYSNFYHYITQIFAIVSFNYIQIHWLIYTPTWHIKIPHVRTLYIKWHWIIELQELSEEAI